MDSLAIKCDELLQSKKYEKIIILCDDVLKLNSQNSIALINKGYALAFLEQFESAINCYDLILKNELNNSNA